MLLMLLHHVVHPIPHFSTTFLSFSSVTSAFLLILSPNLVHSLEIRAKYKIVDIFAKKLMSLGHECLLYFPLISGKHLASLAFVHLTC